ncbi:DUF1311 domain-containing protein [Kosakonia cowanii]|uniref:lysozyme inhibitor LprI family protein n=1 Tax=Kosakonia cowanii TaxID=208223 RepID=UPI0023F9BBE8|nr:lysozyme inhibitor LprI family protein [Kosakonia cowanii]MDF7758166.1 DUF1311 domain-containing protein [Kosakonia cowanii]
MKINVFFVALFIFANGAFAASKASFEQKSISHCIEKYGENDDECLEDVNDTSEAALNKAYEAKLKEISSFDYTRWWRGSQEQKDRMLATYKQNQTEWLQYRNNYCELVSTQAMGTHAFGEAMLGCVLNMNTLRIDQINKIRL